MIKKLELHEITAAYESYKSRYEKETIFVFVCISRVGQNCSIVVVSTPALVLIAQEKAIENNSSAFEYFVSPVCDDE